MSEDEKVTVETIPLTDQQLLEAKAEALLEAAKDMEVQLDGFRHVIKLMGDKLAPTRQRLERMLEVLREANKP